jgi:hypothetical protein
MEARRTGWQALSLGGKKWHLEGPRKQTESAHHRKTGRSNEKTMKNIFQKNYQTGNFRHFAWHIEVQT